MGEGSIVSSRGAGPEEEASCRVIGRIDGSASASSGGGAFVKAVTTESSSMLTSSSVRPLRSLGTHVEGEGDTWVGSHGCRRPRSCRARAGMSTRRRLLPHVFECRPRGGLSPLRDGVIEADSLKRGHFLVTHDHGDARTELAEDLCVLDRDDATARDHDVGR